MAEPDPHPRPHCLACVHFRNDATFLEAAFGGLTSLSSGFGSARGDDGICLIHDRYLSASSFCAQFSAAHASRSQAAPA